MENDYLEGKKNFFIRMFFYMKNGCLIINDFRNVGLGIFALYFTLKLENPIWLAIMTLTSLPVLVIMGWVYVHHIQKVQEWLSIKFGTHYGIKQFDLNQKQVELLEEINMKL